MFKIRLDGNKIIEMGTNARNKVESEFTFDSVAKRIINFCNEKQNP